MKDIALIFTKIFKSRTLIVNWGTLIAATLTLWTGSELVAQYPAVATTLGSVLAGVNIVLRYVTVKPLSER